MLLVVSGVFPHAILVAEDHAAAFNVTVVMVFVQTLAARVARIICSIPVIMTKNVMKKSLQVVISKGLLAYNLIPFFKACFYSHVWTLLIVLLLTVCSL